MVCRVHGGIQRQTRVNQEELPYCLDKKKWTSYPAGSGTMIRAGIGSLVNFG
jgi:hypothetical protein